MGMRIVTERKQFHCCTNGLWYMGNSPLGIVVECEECGTRWKCIKRRISIAQVLLTTAPHKNRDRIWVKIS